MIPKNCLDYILAQEKDSWLTHDDLAIFVDIYMALQEPTGLIIKTHNTSSSATPNSKTPKSHTSQQVAKVKTVLSLK